jgi:hypothetical protein
MKSLVLCHRHFARGRDSTAAAYDASGHRIAGNARLMPERARWASALRISLSDGASASTR